MIDFLSKGTTMKYLLSLIIFLSVSVNPIYAEQNQPLNTETIEQISLMNTDILLASIEQFSEVPAVQNRCCRVCKKGKACGNSCIARSKTCHQLSGCACDG